MTTPQLAVASAVVGATEVQEVEVELRAADPVARRIELEVV